MPEYTLEELDERYLRQDDESPLMQAMQQLIADGRRFGDILTGFIAATHQRFDATHQRFDRMDERMDRLDQRMSRLETEVHEIKDLIGKDKTRH